MKIIASILLDAKIILANERPTVIYVDFQHIKVLNWVYRFECMCRFYAESKSAGSLCDAVMSVDDRRQPLIFPSSFDMIPF